MKVVVLDYGSGNLRSAERAVAATGVDVEVTADPAAAIAADGLVVPGVGAFAACMAGIRAVGGDDVVRERIAAGKPTLGICVGMQILYQAGDEHGVHTDGIGVLEGTVERLEAPVLPHMGWNTVKSPKSSVLFAGVQYERFYFVHSYGVMAGTSRLAATSPGESVTEHGSSRFVAAIESGPLAATQFHPEKSGAAGARLLANWIDSIR